MLISKIKASLLMAAFLVLPIFAQGDGGAGAAVAAPAGTGEAVAAPAGTGAAVAAPAGTGEAVAAPDGDGEAASAPPGLFGGSFLWIMIAMFAIIYFIMIRPEQRKQKERQRMLSALRKGDRVVTIGGLVGVITTVKDNTYIIKSGEGAVFEITKSAISSNITDNKDVSGAAPAEATQADAKESK